MKTFVKFFLPYEEKLRKKIKKSGLTITVSGLAGSGKTTGARAIAKAFKLRYYEAGKIQKALAGKKRISLEQQVKTREDEVDYGMDRKTLELAMKGGFVLVGRLTGWVAGGWADLRIFYSVPLRVRVKRIAKREGISIAEAMRRLRLRDREDRKKYKKIYEIDLLDRSIYDIVFNNSKLSLEESKKAIVRLVRSSLRKKAVIAISALPGAGSTTVAKVLAKKLNLNYFSPGEIFKSFGKGGEINAALEVWKGRGKKKGFHQRLDRQQREIARRGGYVICGKLSIFTLKDLANLKVWINAPLKVRAARVAKRDKLTVKDAEKLLKEREKIEREEWKRIYGIDYLEQKKMADLVIDVSNLTPQQTVKKILKNLAI